MSYFIQFVKRKGFYLPTDGNENYTVAASQINHQLMKHGFIMTETLFNRVATQDQKTLVELYDNLNKGLERVVGGDGYEPIYRNFPQSVMALSNEDIYINAITHYWSAGTWRPEDADYLKREFAVETIDYKEIGLLDDAEYNSIFTDIIYSGKSISGFDKEVIDWFIGQGVSFDMNKISFKETASYVGKRLLENVNVDILPTRDATQVLRIWSAYSGGDEGLKENTRFKNPDARQRRVLLSTLDAAYNLEESFKMYREKWLRLLFFLHPMRNTNMNRYKNVYKYTDLVRNNPKALRTFNSYVEEMLSNNDIEVLQLLKKRMGVFTRRLDHVVRLFGVNAVEEWLSNNPSVNQMIDAYNHFTNRDKTQEGRSAVLASQSKSEVVTYGSLDALPTEMVDGIKAAIMSRLREHKNELLVDKRVYIDKSLYYRTFNVNNRASSLSLGGALSGTVTRVPDGKYIRMYVHWEGRDDIDLSGLLIGNDNDVTKVGWNGTYSHDNAVVYSGDNTGYADKNAEYLDINIDALTDIEWVITDARIYRGKASYEKYGGTVRSGWMMITRPEANSHWQPKTIDNAFVLNSGSKSAYLMALHVPTRSLVTLDLSMGNHNVTTNEDALKMRIYLDSFIGSGSDSDEINWERINQGHLINLIAGEVVNNPEEAEIVFDENSTYEEITKFLN